MKLDVVYVPKGAALEYAPLAVNLYTGCSHGCKYCFAPACLHVTREEFSVPVARKDILSRLARDAQKLFGDERPILMCFTCDPFPELEKQLLLTQRAMIVLGSLKMKVRVLTKNGALAQRDFPTMKQYDVEFGETISFDDEHLREEWEPGAPSIASRMNAMAEAHRLGIRTWVSMEPVIEAAPALRVLDLLKDYVDVWKIGKLNHMAAVEKLVDWRAFLRAALEKLEGMSCGYFIKDALWKFADESIKARWPKERCEWPR